MQVSVVIPAFNAAKYLKEAILSVLKQDLACEILLIDDGSIDDTVEIAKNLNCTVKSLNANYGIGTARYVGSKVAKGDILCFLSADDAYAKNYLREILPKVPKNGAAFSNYFVCNEDLIPYGRFKAPECDSQEEFRNTCLQYALGQNMFVNFSTVAISKSVFEKVTFDNELRFGEDLLFLLDSLLARIPWIHVTKPLLFYRVHRKAGTFTGWHFENWSNLWLRLAPLLRDFEIPSNVIYAAMRKRYWARFHPLKKLVTIANRNMPYLWQNIKRSKPVRLAWNFAGRRISRL